MSLNTPDKIFLCVGLIDFGGIFVWLGVTLHLAYTKMDLMLNHLKNGPAVMIRTTFKNGGLGGKLFLLSATMGVMTTPNIYLRDGGASTLQLKAVQKINNVQLLHRLAFRWVLYLFRPKNCLNID